MPITVYRSTDSGAPVFAPNVKGSLISVLDACLVNGYGSKSSAGWTKPFSGTRAGSTDPWDSAPLQAAAYRMPAGTTQSYLYVAEARHIWYVQGYENMTSISHTTATGAFPRTTMLQDSTTHAGWYGIKTDSTATSTAIPWELVTNGAFVYFFYRPRSVTYTDSVFSGTMRFMFMFGDITSYKTTDPYKCLCGGMGTTAAGHDQLSSMSSFAGSTLMQYHALGYPTTYDLVPATAGRQPMTIERGIDSLEGGVRVYPTINNSLMNANSRSYGIGFGGEYAFPNPADGSVILDSIQLREFNSTTSTTILRGKLPGAYVFGHRHGGITPGQPFNGTGSFAGKTFELFGVPGTYNISSTFCAMALETTPTGNWS